MESRLLELVRWKTTPAERAALEPLKEPVGSFQATDVLSTDLRGIVTSGALGRFEVAFRVRPPTDERDVLRQLEEEVARGQILDWSSYAARREQLKAVKALEVRGELEAVGQSLSAIGVAVETWCENTYCGFAILTPTEIDALAQHDRILRVDLVEGPANVNADAQAVVRGHQVEQFLPENGGSQTLNGTTAYDGENRGSTAGTTDHLAVLMDVNFPDDEHPGFFEWSSLTDSRIYELYDCDYTPCLARTNAAYYTEGRHATQMAGLLLGDTRDEQDNRFGSGLDKEQARSGMAGEALLRAYRAPGSSDLIRSFDHAVGAGGQ